MKSLVNDNSAIAYMLLVGVGLTIVVVGIAYSFISDFVDAFLSAVITGYVGTPMEDVMDSDSIEGGDFLLMLFKLSLIPSLIALMYWAWNMSMKQEKNY